MMCLCGPLSKSLSLLMCLSFLTFQSKPKTKSNRKYNELQWPLWVGKGDGMLNTPTQSRPKIIQNYQSTLTYLPRLSMIVTIEVLEINREYYRYLGNEAANGNYFCGIHLSSSSLAILNPFYPFPPNIIILRQYYYPLIFQLLTSPPPIFSIQVFDGIFTRCQS